MQAATQAASFTDSFCSDLNTLRLKYELSFRALGKLLGGTAKGASESTIFRLCSAKAKPEEIAKFKPLFAQGFKNHLLSLGKTSDEAFTELSLIFTPEELSLMSIKRTTLTPAVRAKYGLTRDPFEKPRRGESFDYFTTTELEAVYNRILEAINYQQFIAVIGDIGAGKSLMKQRVMDACAASDDKRILWPRCESMDKVRVASILRFVLEAFQHKCPQDAMARSTRLESLLTQQYQDGKRIAIGFDECHRLPAETLTALKNFHEIGSHFVNFLGIVLIGQPSFKATLDKPEFREIAERIEVIEMPSIQKVAWDYATHRIERAGGNIDTLFEQEAINHLIQHCSTPLALGNLCNRALTLAAKYPEPKVTVAFLNSKQAELGVRFEPRLMAVRKA